MESMSLEKCQRPSEIVSVTLPRWESEMFWKCTREHHNSRYLDIFKKKILRVSVLSAFQTSFPRRQASLQLPAFTVWASWDSSTFLPFPASGLRQIHAVRVYWAGNRALRDLFFCIRNFLVLNYFIMKIIHPRGSK